MSSIEVCTICNKGAAGVGLERGGGGGWKQRYLLANESQLEPQEQPMGSAETMLHAELLCTNLARVHSQG